MGTAFIKERCYYNIYLCRRLKQKKLSLMSFWDTTHKIYVTGPDWRKYV